MSVLNRTLRFYPQSLKWQALENGNLLFLVEQSLVAWFHGWRLLYVPCIF